MLHQDHSRFYLVFACHRTLLVVVVMTTHIILFGWIIQLFLGAWLKHFLHFFILQIFKLINLSFYIFILLWIILTFQNISDWETRNATALMWLKIVIDLTFLKFALLWRYFRQIQTLDRVLVWFLSLRFGFFRIVEDQHLLRARLMGCDSLDRNLG